MPKAGAPALRRSRSPAAEPLQTVSDPICSRLPAAARRSYSSFREGAIDSRSCRVGGLVLRITVRVPRWRG